MHIEKTEKQVLVEAAERIGVLIKEFTTENEITISGHYDITVKFDSFANIVEIDTRP